MHMGTHDRSAYTDTEFDFTRYSSEDSLDDVSRAEDLEFESSSRPFSDPEGFVEGKPERGGFAVCCTDITPAAFQKATEVIRRCTGVCFRLHKRQRRKLPRKSKLSRNKKPAAVLASLPVDAECEERFENLFDSRRGKVLGVGTVGGVLRTSDEDFQTLLARKRLPAEVVTKLKTAGHMKDRKGRGDLIFTDSSLTKSMIFYAQTERLGRDGLRFAAPLLQIAEILVHVF